MASDKRGWLFEGADQGEHGFLPGLGDGERQWGEEKADRAGEGLARLADRNADGDAGADQHRPGDGLHQIGDDGDAGKGAAAEQARRNDQALHDKTQNHAQDCDQRKSLDGGAGLLGS